jgi:hypothetical protein
LDSLAASIVQAINGLPEMSFIFFLGIALLPPQAGVIPKTFIADGSYFICLLKP